MKRVDVEKTLTNLTKKGHCPALIFNDDGWWALASGGFQSMNFEALRKNEPFDMTSSFLIEKDEFARTISEAVEKYFEEEDDKFRNECLVYLDE